MAQEVEHILTQLIFRVAIGPGRKLVPALPSPVRIIVLKLYLLPLELKDSADSC